MDLQSKMKVKKNLMDNLQRIWAKAQEIPKKCFFFQILKNLTVNLSQSSSIPAHSTKNLQSTVKFQHALKTKWKIEKSSE